MTREQQRKLKELKTALPKIIAAEIKKHKLKKRDYMIWSQKGELFFDMMTYISEHDDRCYYTSYESIKPLWLDDILWDVLDISENKKEPLSLRAVGAFSVQGSEYYRNKTELFTWTLDELENCVIQSVEHFYQSIQSGDLELFYHYMNSNTYHQELRHALSLTYNGEYQDAIDYLGTRGKGCLCNGSLWVHPAITDYCKSKLTCQFAP